MIKSVKRVEKRRKGISVVGVAYLSLAGGGGGGGGGGSLYSIFEFLLDFRKYDLMILVISSLFPY